MDSFSAQVYGRVQGVSFRYYTQREARRLALTGWVRNEFDGSVTVVAQGAKDKLEQLERFLHTGPRAAIVDKVDIRWQTADKMYKDFSIRWR
jgi:acylphosphatase